MHGILLPKAYISISIFEHIDAITILYIAITLAVTVTVEVHKSVLFLYF